MPKHKVHEVFGESRDVPLNYVERDYVDENLLDYLERDPHVVVYGGTKQGKTTLREKHLGEDEAIYASCNREWEITDLHGQILKKAGYNITMTEKKSFTGNQKFKATFKGIGGEKSSSEKDEEETKPLELDLSDENDIIKALEDLDFNKYVVLDDFHILKKDLQKKFADKLKTYFDSSDIKFIMIGIWLEENRIIARSGHLGNRVISVDADEWERRDLRQVIEKGEYKLNVEFDEEFKQNLLDNCHNSVYIVQEVCREACEQEDVSEALSEKTTIGGNLDVGDIMDTVLTKKQGSRYRSFIRDYSSGFGESKLEMHKWIIYVVLTSSEEELSGGLQYNDILEKIMKEHPRGEDLNAGNLTSALNLAAKLQLKIDTELIMDYDESKKRLTVVDRGFLIWMKETDEEDLLGYIKGDTSHFD